MPDHEVADKRKWRPSPFVKTICFAINYCFLLVNVVNLDSAVRYGDDFFIYFLGAASIGQVIVMIAYFSGPAYYLAPVFLSLARMLARIGGGRNGS